MPLCSQTRKLGWNLFRGAGGIARYHRGNVTPQDLLLPEGKLIRTTRGGPNALKQLLLDLKKYSFSGYVRTVRNAAAKRSEGIVLLRGGNPDACLYQREDSQDRGRSALKKVWQDSYDESCLLELHARVDMESLVREYADAILERPAKVVKKAKVPEAMNREDVEKQVGSWKGKGYDASSVESNLDAEPGVLIASVVGMREAVKKAEAVAEILDSLDVTGFESRAAILRVKLHDPVKNPDIDTEVESLRDAVESLHEIEARRRVEVTRGRDSQERTKKALELAMKQPRSLRSEAASPSTEEVVGVPEEASPARGSVEPITRDLAHEAPSGRKVEPTGEPSTGRTVEGEPTPPSGSDQLTPGRSYLIEEDRPAEAFRLFAEFLGGGGGGLVITRTNPKRVREAYDLPAERILWLTDREGSTEETIAPTLERIVYEIEDFMSQQPRGAVMLDGIEYLVSNNSFDAVLKFVRRLLDAFSESRHAFILSLGPATLKERELKVLEREMDVIRVP